MARNRGKSKSFIETLAIVFLVTLVLISGIIFAYLRSNIKDKQETFDFLQNKNNELQNEMTNIKQQQTDLEEEIVKAKDVNKQIELVRNEFTSLALQLEQDIQNGNNPNKIAYLTFDDGPYLLSNSFLDVLDEHDAKATFFYLKKTPEYGYDEDTSNTYLNTYQRIINSGHVLGNHTASHRLGPNGIYSSVDSFIASVKENREFIQNTFDYTTTVFRFPGGSSTAGYKYEDIASKLREMGYCWADWNSMTGDGGGIVPVDESIANVLDTTNDRKLLLVLMHDYSNNTLEALPNIIEGLREQGYSFLPLFNGSSVVSN